MGSDRSLRRKSYMSSRRNSNSNIAVHLVGEYDPGKRSHLKLSVSDFNKASALKQI